MNEENNLLRSSPPHAHKYRLGLIGNCAYSALISEDANIRWLCWPRFDSTFIFGSLLDVNKGGEFFIRPASKNYVSTQRYLENTNILVTKFEASDGVFEVIDFAPRFRQYERYHKPLALFRKVVKLSGNPRIHVKCSPVGDYGAIQAKPAMGSNHIRYDGLSQPLRLTTDAPLTYILQEKDFALGDQLHFILSWGIPLEAPLNTTFNVFFNQTKDYWENWVKGCTLPNLFQKEVVRSALVLKLHQFEDTGGIIAACTSSLPEIHGEGRNWDYRYCWLRDTYYTLSALKSLGHFEEMEKYAHFIENLNLEHLTNLQPVYCIDGSPKMPEIELPLDGYLGNKPVRVGNLASEQLQNDAYGQILLALFSLYTDERLLSHSDRTSARLLNMVLKYIEKSMLEPDNGIWEFRGKTALHSYSSLFHWAGSAAVRKVACDIDDEALLQRALNCMQQSSQLLEQAYIPEKKAYGQAVGSTDLDASLLQMITLGYFKDNRQGALDHLYAIERELELAPGFLLRYKHRDDFGYQESAFLVCSFWHIEAVASLGMGQRALELLTEVTKAQNHLGLMAEDYDIKTSSQWGNFPQTYSHVGLINSAFAIDKALNLPPYLCDSKGTLFGT